MSGLTACDGVDKEHAIKAPISYDAKVNKFGISSTYEIGPYVLYDMLTNKENFVIEFYSPTCSSCTALEPILDKYILNSNYQWYRFNTSMSEEDEAFFTSVVMKEFPDVLGHLEYVPSIYFIKEGKLSYEVDSKKFGSYTAFATIIKKHFIKANYYSISTLDGLKSFLHENPNNVIYAYDSTSTVSTDIYHTIYDHVKSSSAPLLLLSRNAMNVDNYLQIASYLGRNYTDNFACLFENGELKKTVDYSYDDGKAFKEYIISYLG